MLDSQSDGCTWLGLNDTGRRIIKSQSHPSISVGNLTGEARRREQDV